MNKFSIVVPVYNESKNLPLLITKIFKFLKNKKFELIIVDDNSSDNTAKIMKKLKRKNLKYILRKQKKDLTKSCIDGFRKSKYKYILVMDGDLQHRPSDIKKFLYVFKKKDPEIVVGTRNLFYGENHNLSFFRLMASRFLIIIVNSFLGSKTTDPMSGFFMFNKKIFFENEHKLFKKGYKILLDLLYVCENNEKILDVKINFDTRKKGKSKMSFKILFYLIIMIFFKFYIRIFK